MRLSTSLQKNILETTAGGILNKFLVRRRRNVLFFEDILADYVRECEKSGFTGDTKLLGQRWMNLTTQQLMPNSLKRLPTQLFFNVIARKVWVNLGLMDYLQVDRKGAAIEVETKNEIITRLVGPNGVSVGIYTGVLNILFKSQVRCVDATQKKESCEYLFEIEDKPFGIIKAKEKTDYDRLNYLEPARGFTLKDTLSRGVFQLKSDNKIYFRENLISPIENTVFHLIGNHGLLLERIPDISFNYFKKIVERKTTDEQRLNLIKNLLQIMGWGVIQIVLKDRDEILFEIKNPPYGLQPEKDNWIFMSKVILGYLWLLNEDFKITDVKTGYKNLKITYIKE